MAGAPNTGPWAPFSLQPHGFWHFPEAEARRVRTHSGSHHVYSNHDMLACSLRPASCSSTMPCSRSNLSAFCALDVYTEAPLPGLFKARRAGMSWAHGFKWHLVPWVMHFCSINCTCPLLMVDLGRHSYGKQAVRICLFAKPQKHREMHMQRFTDSEVSMATGRSS